MKIHTIPLLLLTSVGLLGCNTLVTKPNSATNGFSQEGLAFDDPKMDEFMNASLRIAEISSNDESESDFFSKGWVIDVEPEKTSRNQSHETKMAITQVHHSNLGRSTRSHDVVVNSSRSSSTDPVAQVNPLIANNPKTLGQKNTKEIQLKAKRRAEENKANKLKVKIRPTTTKTVQTIKVKKPTKPTQPAQKVASIKKLAKTQLKRKKSQTRVNPNAKTQSTLQAKSVVTAKKINDNTLKVKKNVAKNQLNFHKSNNLWDRIRKGYKLPIIEQSKIDDYIDKYLQHSYYFKRISTKASPYLYYIVQELEKRGMPLEIALLPAIESAYEPMALSHKSAAGLWQFVPATGKDYGLIQNEWYDGRRDIMASTTAALDYLQKLYKLFDNDWLLALAAYNYGQGNLRKSINKNEELGKLTDFWSLDLPTETRQYVPKLLALAEIVAHSQKYGIQLSFIANKPLLQKVRLNNQMSLSLAAQLAGLLPTEFKRLNAGYRRETMAPEGAYDIILPIDKVRPFKQLVAEMSVQNMMFTQTKMLTEPNTSLTEENTESQATSPSTQLAVSTTQLHHVNEGENLWKIAKHYGTTVATLRQLNNLTNDSLHVGEQLNVPVSQTETTLVAAASQTNVTPSKPQVNEEVSTKPQKHQISQGENLWQIAKHYGTTVSMLKKLNELKSNYLKVGSFLIIPTTIATLQKSSLENSKKKRIIHTVQSGESLWSIARHYQVSVVNLSQWNSLPADHALNLGQKLTIWHEKETLN